MQPSREKARRLGSGRAGRRAVSKPLREPSGFLRHCWTTTIASPRRAIGEGVKPAASRGTGGRGGRIGWYQSAAPWVGDSESREGR